MRPVPPTTKRSTGPGTATSPRKRCVWLVEWEITLLLSTTAHVNNPTGLVCKTATHQPPTNQPTHSLNRDTQAQRQRQLKEGTPGHAIEAACFFPGLTLSFTHPAVVFGCRNGTIVKYVVVLVVIIAHTHDVCLHNCAHHWLRHVASRCGHRSSSYSCRC